MSRQPGSGKAETRVLEAIREMHEATIQELAERLELSEGFVRDLVLVLIHRREVRIARYKKGRGNKRVRVFAVETDSQRSTFRAVREFYKRYNDTTKVQ